MSLKIRKTIVIVCEGSVTEPNYFQGIANFIKSKRLDYTIHIRPKPSLEDFQEDTGQLNPPRKGKRRALKIVDEEPQTIFVPEEYKAQPISYVWQAREELKVMDESWAVFDKDNHPRIEEAFDLAKQPVNDKLINIAFSSIAFENWILAHFEELKNPFDKAECRTKNKKHKCGQKIHPNDCDGKECITGYLKVKNYVSVNEDIKHIKFEGIIERNTLTAIVNASAARKAIWNGEAPIHAVNPFTNVDKLVFKLLYLEFDYKWLSFQEAKAYQLSLSFVEKDNNLDVIFTNNTNQTQIIDPSEFTFLNVDNHSPLSGNRLVLAADQTDTWSFSIAKLDETKPLYFRLPLKNGQYGVIEL